MKCCLTECNNEARNLVSTSLLGDIPFCNSCNKLFELSVKNRDERFFNEGVESVSKEKKN